MNKVQATAGNTNIKIYLRAPLGFDGLSTSLPLVLKTLDLKIKSQSFKATVWEVCFNCDLPDDHHDDSHNKQLNKRRLKIMNFRQLRFVLLLLLQS